jgi:predicted metal-binding protein
MKEEQLKSIMEVFVCNHKRENEECCFDKGSKELTDKLRKWTKEELNKEIVFYRGGCMGRCSEGIALACYPQKKFMLDVKQTDFEEIKEGLKEALDKLKT